MKIRQIMFDWISVRCMLFVWSFLAFLHIGSIMFALIVWFEIIKFHNMLEPVQIPLIVAGSIAFMFVVCSIGYKKEDIVCTNSLMKHGNPYSFYFHWLPRGVTWIVKEIYILFKKGGKNEEIAKTV